MEIRTHYMAESLARCFVLSIMPIGQLILQRMTWAYSMGMEGIVLIMSYLAYAHMKKHSLLYASDPEKIHIHASKEGYYDPDTIRYRDIKNVERIGKVLRIVTKDEKVITLSNLGRHIERVHEDITEKMDQKN